MEGLSKRKRRVYLGVMVVIFIAVAPVLVLYSSGYRLSENFTLIKTGGIHVSVARAGASFYLNGKFQGTGSIFQKGFFVQNLKPGTYTVRVEREGYHLWQKQLQVFPTVISEARALQLPKKPELIPIPAFLDPESGQATTPGDFTVSLRTNPEYKELVDIFESADTGATTTILYKKATTTVRVDGGIGLWQDHEGVHTWWLEEKEESPYFFCASQQECKREILVYSGDREISRIDFLPNDNQFIVLERRDGIYVTELDIRPLQNIQPLYDVSGAQFRIVGERIYVLDGEDLFEIDV